MSGWKHEWGKTSTWRWTPRGPSRPQALVPVWEAKQAAAISQRSTEEANEGSRAESKFDGMAQWGGKEERLKLRNPGGTFSQTAHDCRGHGWAVLKTTRHPQHSHLGAADTEQCLEAVGAPPPRSTPILPVAPWAGASGISDQITVHSPTPGTVNKGATQGIMMVLPALGTQFYLCPSNPNDFQDLFFF